MKVIECNPDQNVGICIDMDLKDNDHIGVFNSGKLLEWAQMVVQNYGPDTKMQVFTHKSTAVKAKALATSEDGEEPYIVITSYMEE